MSVANSNWYVLRVISGKERKLKEWITREIDRSGWTETITQVLVPTEKVYQIKNGKKVIKERNFFPGYIMIESGGGKLSGEMISTITQMTGVIHFLGKSNPQPMKQAEVNRILGKVDEMEGVGESINEPFIVGETVKITDGPVKIFGRRTPVELNFMQVEKV